MTNELNFNSIVQYEKNIHNTFKYISLFLLIVFFTIYFVYKIGPITFLIQTIMFSLFCFIRRGPKQKTSKKSFKSLFDKTNFNYYDVTIPVFNSVENTFEIIIKNSEKIRGKLTDVKILIPKNNIEKIVVNSNDGAVIIFYSTAIMESYKNNRKIIKEKDKNNVLFYIDKDKINDFKKYLKGNSFDYIEEDDKYIED